MTAAVQLYDGSGAPIGAPAASRRTDPLTLVRDAGGVPQPPSHIVEELRTRTGDPCIGLRYASVEWQFIRTWPAHDKRWARIQNGEYPEDAAYDVIGTLPIDCSLDQAASYAERCLRDYPVEEIRRLADSIAQYNVTGVAKQHIGTVLDATFSGGGDVQAIGGLGEQVGRNEGQVSVLSDVTPSAPKASPSQAPSKRRRKR